MITDYFTLPQRPRPVYIIGAGGIVNDAHLPAYQLADFNVAGIFDINKKRAEEVAYKFSIPVVFNGLKEMVLSTQKTDAVFDVAVPGDAIIDTLQQLPDKASVLIQKPMGDNYEEAKEILAITRSRKMLAAVNFQLRYAPLITEARRMIAEGRIGDLCDIEVNINVYTPWHLWKFLYELPRVEILYHSIHYIDLIRSFLGTPVSVYAKTVKHPLMKELASVRTSIILDYGDMIRATILTNHCHQFGLDNQHAYIKFEGTKGAIKVQLGLLMDYPKGISDKFEYATYDKGEKFLWKTKEVDGSWFPHAFIGSMSQVMLAAEGTIEQPDNSVEDCIYTMACVEAAYRSSEMRGVRIEDYVS